ncbi:MAG: hypothetical protein HUJ58_07340 [Erysipelotrichaceae bacterium]|nr:hypothetical protein [Erysipelotrichaceae bacterium]
MTKIILTAHGELSSAFLYSVGMIAGQQDPEQVAAVNFYPNDSLDVLKGRIEEQLIKFEPEKNHVIIFCDLKSGSPFNASFMLSQKYPVTIIYGMNLPSLLEILLMKDMYATKEDLIPVVATCKDSIGMVEEAPKARGGERRGRRDV